MQQGRHVEAEPLLRRALAIAGQAGGPDHPNVAATVGALGSVLHTLGQYEEAESLLQRSLDVLGAQVAQSAPVVGLGFRVSSSLGVARAHARTPASWSSPTGATIPRPAGRSLSGISRDPEAVSIEDRVRAISRLDS